MGLVQAEYTELALQLIGGGHPCGVGPVYRELVERCLAQGELKLAEQFAQAIPPYAVAHRAFALGRVAVLAQSPSLADVARQLKELPAGRYAVESVDDVPALTEEEEEGLYKAMASLRAGNGVPAEEGERLLEARARKQSRRCRNLG